VAWDHSALDAWLDKVTSSFSSSPFQRAISRRLLRAYCCACISSCHVSRRFFSLQEMKESSSDTLFYVFGGTEPQVTYSL
jgi:hypothetical protein